MSFLDSLGQALGTVVRTYGDKAKETLQDYEEGLYETEDMSSREVFNQLKDSSNSLGKRMACKKELENRGIINRTDGGK